MTRVTVGYTRKQRVPPIYCRPSLPPSIHGTVHSNLHGFSKSTRDPGDHAAGHTRRKCRRRQCGAQSSFVAAFTYHTTAPQHHDHRQATGTQNPHLRLSGVWCGTRAVTMGQGGLTGAGQDTAHARCRGTVLVARDSGQQSSTRVGQ